MFKSIYQIVEIFLPSNSEYESSLSLSNNEWLIRLWNFLGLLKLRVEVEIIYYIANKVHICPLKRKSALPQIEA